MRDTEGELEQVGHIRDEIVLFCLVAKKVPRRPLRHARSRIIALSEIGLAAHLVALVGEHLHDASENAIDELASDFLLSVGCSLLDAWAVTFHTFGHHQALLHLLEGSLLLFLPFSGHFGFKSALDGSKTCTESLTGTVDESCKSRNARLDDSLMRLRDFFVVAEPLMILHPLQDHRFGALERSFLDRLECPDEVDQVTILLPDASEVLAISLVLNPLKLCLEVQSVTHLIEQKGEEEVAVTISEGREPCRFIIVKRRSESIAAGKRVSDRAEDSACDIEIGQEQSVVQPLLHLLPVHSDVVVEVGLGVNRVDQVIDAQVCVISVRVSEFHSDEERVHLEEVLGGGERLLGLPEVLVSVALADDGLMCHSVEFILILLAKLLQGLLVVQGAT